MSSGFRFEPRAIDGTVVDRDRVVSLLDGRYTNRLTLVVAPAGAGKSTALALAVAARRDDPRHLDVWLGAGPLDDDPDHVGSDLARALGLTPGADTDENVAAITEWVWEAAPAQVAIVIDDVHHLREGSASFLHDLLDGLPSNGHLVLAGRAAPPLRTARWRANGELLEVGQDDLAFDDDEAAGLADAHGQPDVPLRDLPRHAAFAALRLRTGGDASAGAVWDEVFGALPPERVAALARASVATQLDDETALTVSGGRWSADELLDGVPLVSRSSTGRRRMHDLLRDALAARLTSDERRQAIEPLVELERTRGSYREAALLAGDVDESLMLAVAREYALSPTLERTFDDLRTMHSIVDRAAPGSPLAELLATEVRWGESNPGSEHRALIASLERAARVAREAGDDEVEATAIFRACQGHFLEGPEVPNHLEDRLAELAATVPYAAQVVRHVRSEATMHRGDPDGSIHHLAGPVALADVERVMAAGQLCSLGRVEDVAHDLTPDDFGELPPGGRLYPGLAMWLRGEASPEVALEIARPLVDETAARRVVHPTVSTIGVVTVIALAAGATDEAEELVERARQVERWGCAPVIAAFTDLGEAGVALLRHGDDAAAERLGEMLRRVPLGRWPTRAYLLALPMIHVLRPETRDVLDACPMGRSMTVGLDAARALEALRAGDAAPAAALPWDRHDLLRAHVLPPHLRELATAAARTTPAAAALLDAIPAPQRGDVGTVAIRTLGELRVVIDGVEVTDDRFVRRRRVRELLGLLVTERTVTRERAATALWPDLDASKAAANLRVTLSYLLASLSERREPGSADRVVRVDGDRLALAPGVDVDVDMVERTLRDARELERQGEAAHALERYRRALDMAHGPYLPGFDHPPARERDERITFLLGEATRRVDELIRSASDTHAPRGSDPAD